MEIIFNMSPTQRFYAYIFDEKNNLQSNIPFYPVDFEKTAERLFKTYKNIKKVVFKGPSAYTKKYMNDFKEYTVSQYGLNDLIIEQL